MASLTLTKTMLEGIVQIGNMRQPCEAVGIIVHRTAIVELPNRSLTSHTSFVLDVNDIPLQLQLLDIDMTADDWTRIVVWHTHPNGFIGPSKVDLRNKVPGVTHLVIALTEDKPIPTFY